jgi:hypothetical protein
MASLGITRNLVEKDLVVWHLTFSFKLGSKNQYPKIIVGINLQQPNI